MDSLMKRFDNPITPKQRGKIMGLMRVRKPVIDIVKEAGASIAIETLLHGINSHIQTTLLIFPPECFCDKYDKRNGQADLRTLRHPRYMDGISLKLLVELTEEGEKALKSMEAKRGAGEILSLSDDGLKEILEVKRFKLIE